MLVLNFHITAMYADVFLLPPTLWIVCEPLFPCHSRYMVQAFIKHTILLLHIFCEITNEYVVSTVHQETYVYIAPTLAYLLIFSFLHSEHYVEHLSFTSSLQSAL